jgi:hypothetical protein
MEQVDIFQSAPKVKFRYLMRKKYNLKQVATNYNSKRNAKLLAEALRLWNDRIETDQDLK